MYAVSNKRAKLNLDSALLWHCRLGHISKKRIGKLQHDGLLNSTDLRAFEKYVSCMSGKMARKLYTHQVERAKDLLGLILTDVFGPFRTVSRQGASYFVTFTDDFSHYGYVYLLKHKHEVFETFKVFQKEVENQLRKTIKSLRSDRGGEYMSQEFLDHLKEHGIIAHRTPSYTPQHNGMPERRNRTPLDMVHSMMSQTTLPKSFWIMPLRLLHAFSIWFQLRRSKRHHTNLITQEASRSLEDLEIIQEEYTHPSINTSSHHEDDDLEIDEPQSDIIPIHNGVWDLVDLLPNGKTIGSKWLFKKKADMDGAVHTFKARLVAKGFTQTYMVDYEETFSPVGDTRAIRILIAIAAYYDYEIWQMDVKNAFLNGHLLEEQASRQWNKRFDDEIKKFGLTQNRDEPCVYLKASGNNVTFLILYVDDILIMGNNIPMLQDVKSYLRRCFAMKDLGASTPAELKRMQNVPYASAVGSIMYAVRCTRHDVAFAQNITSQFQHNPGDIKQELRVSCYTDAGYLTDADDLNIFATSSAEVEYIAAYDASKEAVGAITIANESGITKGARHFRAKVHYLREVIVYGDVKLEKVHTDYNLADPFTKALAFPKHSDDTKNIGMLPASSLM
ncbi:retrotransposon protein, putative, ty1-copia subclass [Tanacetum coccineum]